MGSKALLMSIAISRVLLCGGFWLKTSAMSSVNCVSKVLVERCDLKPCWVCESGMCGVL